MENKLIDDIIKEMILSWRKHENKVRIGKGLNCPLKYSHEKGFEYK